jgi:hypothetical protein
MANVTIKPMPAAYREIPERLRPGHPPIFDGDPTPEDVELAQALFAELDAESQRWYRGRGTWLFP